MNPYRVDLNLLGIFNAILETGSVTAAANRYGITQPAMSNALARLRRLFDDPLFVPMANGMRPTPFALEIAGTVNRGLHAFEEAFEHHKRFEPLHSRRVYRFHMTDMAQMIFLPRILARLRTIGPNLQVDARTLDAQSIRPALEEGQIDFAVGRLPRLRGRGLRHVRLFRDHYEVLMRADHPLAGSPLKQKQFLNASHGVVKAFGGAHQVVEDTLTRLRARIVLRIPYFMVIPTIISRTDALFTVPSHLSLALAGSGDVYASLVPIEIPRFDVCVYWHDRFDTDPAMNWMRALLMDLFSPSEMPTNQPAAE
jgi:DNA-binding transcriptional LysR family regulator